MSHDSCISCFLIRRGQGGPPFCTGSPLCDTGRSTVSYREVQRMHSGRSTAFSLFFEIFTAALYRKVHLVEGSAIPGGPPTLFPRGDIPGGPPWGLLAKCRKACALRGSPPKKRSCVMAAFKHDKGGPKWTSRYGCALTVDHRVCASTVDLPVCHGGPARMQSAWWTSRYERLRRWTCAYGTERVFTRFSKRLYFLLLPPVKRASVHVPLQSRLLAILPSHGRP